MGWLTNFSNSLFSGSFANPAYILPAALLISVPIIIHFINRMRYRRVKWAAMEFLLASQKKNRRRLLLEQLLLLLLRILAVAAIVALIARPLLDASQFTLLRGQKTNHVVLLDDTGSMREKQGASTVFKGAVDVVSKLVAEGARRPGTQTLTLVRLSEPDAPLYVVRNLDKEFQDEFARRAESMVCSHRAADWPAAIAACTRILESQKGSILNFHLISDFRSQDWADAKAAAQGLRTISELGSVNFVRATPQGSQGDNLGITDLSGNVEVAAASVPLRLKVSVRNFSDKVQRDIAVSVFQDGQPLPVTVPFRPLEAGREESREFEVMFATTGDHSLRVALQPDALEQDNDRFLAVRVPDVNPVLIVATESSVVVQDIQEAISPSPGITGFAAQIQNPDFLRRSSLDRFQAILIVDVPQLHPDAVRSLESYVESGGGLCWFLGPQVNVSHYNERLYRQGFGIGPEEKLPADTFRKRDQNADGKLTAPEFSGVTSREGPRALQEAFRLLDKNRDGSLSFREFTTPRNGLFPLKLGSVATLPPDVNELPAPDIDFTDHPLFNVFTSENNPFINLVKVAQHFSPAKSWQPDEGVKVIASLRTLSPLFLEHRYGTGTVVTCLTSCRDWSNWATIGPAFVVTQLEIVKHISKGRNAQERRVVGEPIRTRLDPAVYKQEITVLRPDGSRENRKAAAETSTPEASSARDGASGKAEASGATVPYVDEFRETDIPGVYGLLRRPLSGGEETQRMAYNVPVSESRLEVVGTDGLRKNLGTGLPVTIQEFETFNWITGKQTGMELHDLVMYALLFILVCEQLMAFRLSFHPKQRASPIA